MPRGVPKNGKRQSRKSVPLVPKGQKPPKEEKTKKADNSLSLVEKRQAGEELEKMFNICAEHEYMPGEPVFKLVKWLQE